MLLMIPGPTNVPERIMKALGKPIMNHRGPAFQSLYKGLLENLKYAFQTKNDVFPLTCSGTGGVECAVSNVICRGEKIVVPVNGLFSQRLKENIIRFGGVPIEIPVEWGSVCSVEDVKAALDSEKDVKAVALVYNETSTGSTVRDLPQIGKLTRKRDKLLLVDAISVLVGDNLPVDEWNVDVCIAGSQKCLACPPGLAFVSVSPKAYEAAEGNKYKTYYSDLTLWREFKEKLETPFTPSIPLYYTLDEALRMLIEEGLENRIRRHKNCGEAFYAAFEAMGLDTVTQGMARSNTVIVHYLPPNIEDKEFRGNLLETYEIAISGGVSKLKGKTFRIGSMGTVSKEDVLRTAQGIHATFTKLRYNPNVKLEELKEKIDSKFV